MTDKWVNQSANNSRNSSSKSVSNLFRCIDGPFFVNTLLILDYPSLLTRRLTTISISYSCMFTSSLLSSLSSVILLLSLHGSYLSQLLNIINLFPNYKLRSCYWHSLLLPWIFDPLLNIFLPVAVLCNVDGIYWVCYFFMIEENIMLFWHGYFLDPLDV